MGIYQEHELKACHTDGNHEKKRLFLHTLAAYQLGCGVGIVPQVSRKVPASEPAVRPPVENQRWIHDLYEYINANACLPQTS